MVSKIIIKWYENNARDLPWRRTNDPYKIWVSEIILQQTRVNQGLHFYNSIFPTEYNELLKLKGIGDYTAAAVASIAFNKPTAVVDGNVYRILSRLYGIDIPINIPEGKKVFYEKANNYAFPVVIGRYLKSFFNKR